MTASISINRLQLVPEARLVDEIRSFREIDEADIVTAFRDQQGTFTVESTVIVLNQQTSLTGTPITKIGKMSMFGGPNDTGIPAGGDLALFFNNPADADANPDLFLPQQPAGSTGLGRRLNPQAMYLACRWDYAATPKDFLRRTKVKVTNQQTGQSAEARPVDWGPNEATGRVADLSPGLAQALGLVTDNVCRVDIPPPQTGVAVGVNLATIDQTIFPSDMIRQLVAMTTMNNATYWVVNQIGVVEAGQTLMRRVGSNAPEIVLSDSTILPVKPSDQVPEAVAAELNKALKNEPQPAGTQADPAPGPNDDISAKVFAKAAAFVGHDTSNVPGTDHGNLACAWAVNEVVRLALGKPISSDGHGHNGLGTGDLFSVLRTKHAPVDTPRPGVIIISPTPPSGSVHGHVGIVGQNPGGSADNTQIFSNSSSQKKFAQNRTIKSWNARYSAELHLPVLFFELKADQL